MNIHEYQAKELLKIFNVPIVKGALVEDPEDAIEAAKTVSDNLWVVKAQIHAGGRGKGGGVKIAKSLEEVKSLSSEIIGMNLVTHQTGKDGKRVRKIYIEAGTDIAEEFYISMVVDRQTSKISFIASTEGGVDIEEVAEKTIDCFKRSVPASVPGIVFLSGGQGDEEATANLDAINRRASLVGAPWELSFSFGRSLQGAPLTAWAGKAENTEAAALAFYTRAKLTGEARRGAA